MSTASRALAGILLLLMVTIMSPLFTLEHTSAASPKFYVDDDYDENTPGWGATRFASIQRAIDNASAGDRILVLEGEYTEQLTIDKKLDVFGENRTTTIISGGTQGIVINITATVSYTHLTLPTN